MSDTRDNTYISDVDLLLRNLHLREDLDRFPTQIWRGWPESALEGFEPSLIAAPFNNIIIGDLEMAENALNVNCTSPCPPCVRNITHVLSMTDRLKPYNTPWIDVYNHHKWGRAKTKHMGFRGGDDIDGATLFTKPGVLEKYFQFIREVHNNPNFTLLIHCYHGLNRSWAIWFAFLLWENGLIHKYGKLG